MDMSLSRPTLRTRTLVRPQREVPSPESMLYPRNSDLSLDRVVPLLVDSGL